MSPLRPFWAYFSTVIFPTNNTISLFAAQLLIDIGLLITRSLRNATGMTKLEIETTGILCIIVFFTYYLSVI